MSDNWIALVPEDPGFVPPAETHQPAIAMFQEIAPEADEIEIKLTETIQFFDCGANFEKITCPKCEKELPIDWWQDRMDDDYENNGFRLSEYSAPCCNESIRLDELRYDWPQAFARFGIDAMNPNIGELTDEQRTKFERILGTPLRTIYQHI